MIDWAEKYRPVTLDDVVGNPAAVSELRNWGRTWGEDKKAVILYGRAGVGKTSAAHALACEMDWDVIELNASDQRTSAAINKVAGSASQNYAFGGMRLIILDEADNLHGNSDRGGAKAIVKIIKKTAQPIILIANDYYEMTKELRNLCKPISFKPLQKSSVASVLRRVSAEESINIEDDAIEELASNSCGDMRSAINDLQAISLGNSCVKIEDVITGSRDKKETIFFALGKIFEGTDMQEALNTVYNIDESPEDLIKWLDENVPIAYEDPSAGFQSLSRSDLYLGRTRKRQNYSLWRYANAMMVCGVLAAKPSARRNGYRPRYQSPSTFRRLGQTRSKRNLRNSLLVKVGTYCHVSRGHAYNLVEFLKMLFGRTEYAISISAAMDLSIDEIALLLDTKKNTKKVSSIYDAAQELIEEENTEFFRMGFSEVQEEIKEETRPAVSQEKDDDKKGQHTLFDF